MELATMHSSKARISDLTFGIELGFKSPTPSNRKKMWVSDSARGNVAKQMADLTGLPIANACPHSDDTDCPNCNRDSEVCIAYGDIFSGRGLCPTPGAHMAQNYFLFKNWPLGKYKQPRTRHKQWSGIEMSTPVFRSHELKEGLPKMNMALGALRQIEAEITANVSCGLHVHVGVSDGMTLLLAQKIATLVVVFENALFKFLVSPSRLGEKSARFIQQYSRMAQDSVATQGEDHYEHPLMTAHTPFTSKLDAAAWNNYKPERFSRLLGLIWSQTTLQGLSAQLLTHRDFKRAGFAISLRDETGSITNYKYFGDLENSQTTVEFRYMQTSFDNAFIQCWIQILFRIVQIAQFGPDEFKKHLEDIVLLIENATEKENPVWEVMLTHVLGVEEQVPAWRDQIERYRRGEDISLLDSNGILVDNDNLNQANSQTDKEGIDWEGDVGEYERIL